MTEKNGRSICFVCAAVLALSAVVRAQPPATPPPPPPAPAPSVAPGGPVPVAVSGRPLYRVSALIKSQDGTKVGLIDMQDNASFFLGEGQSKGDLTLVSADYETEEVVLRLDGRELRLQLASDPNAVISAPAAGTAVASAPSATGGEYKGEGIETFLREHPEARVKSFSQPIFPIPTNLPPAQGFGEGIESFLKDHPELAEKARKPAVGLGEGIEAALGNDPELIKKMQQPAVGMGEGIEKALREHPEWKLQTNPLMPPPGTALPQPAANEAAPASP